METSINQRIKQIVDDSGLTLNSFSKKIGIAQTSLRDCVVNNTEPKFSTLDKIIKAEPLISPEWLLTGNGKMKVLEETLIPIKASEEAITTHHAPKSSEKKLSDQEVYLYDIDAAANLKTLFQNTMDNIIDLIKVPDLPKCDGAVRVKGDSMYPLLKSGDIVFYKQIQDLRNEIFFGEMYLLSMNMAGDEYVVVKYVHRSDVEGCIKLVSYNQHHGPMDVSMETIRAMALVKASLRFNTIK